MLGRIGNAPLEAPQVEMPKLAHPIENYHRNECEDIKKGIEYLYEFKEKLSKLHPIVIDVIEKLLQNQRY